MKTCFLCVLFTCFLRIWWWELQQKWCQALFGWICIWIICMDIYGLYGYVPSLTVISSSERPRTWILRRWLRCCSRHLCIPWWSWQLPVAATAMGRPERSILKDVCSKTIEKNEWLKKFFCRLCSKATMIFQVSTYVAVRCCFGYHHRSWNPPGCSGQRWWSRHWCYWILLLIQLYDLFLGACGWHGFLMGTCPSAHAVTVCSMPSGIQWCLDSEGLLWLLEVCLTMNYRATFITTTYNWVFVAALAVSLVTYMFLVLPTACWVYGLNLIRPWKPSLIFSFHLQWTRFFSSDPSRLCISVFWVCFMSDLRLFVVLYSDLPSFFPEVQLGCCLSFEMPKQTVVLLTPIDSMHTHMYT